METKDSFNLLFVGFWRFNPESKWDYLLISLLYFWSLNSNSQSSVYIPYICSSSRKFWWVDCADAIAFSGSSRVFYLRLYLCIMMLRIVHWLSSKIVIGSTEYSFRSIRNRCNHIDSWAAFANVMCSASAVNKATQVLFLSIPADCSTTYHNESRCWFLAGHHDLQPNLHLRIQQCCHLQDAVIQNQEFQLSISWFFSLQSNVSVLVLMRNEQHFQQHLQYLVLSLLIDKADFTQLIDITLHLPSYPHPLLWLILFQSPQVFPQLLNYPFHMQVVICWLSYAELN